MDLKNIEERYKIFKNQKSKNESELNMMRNAKPTEKNKPQVSSMDSRSQKIPNISILKNAPKNKNNKIKKKVSFDDDYDPETLSVKKEGLMETVSSVATNTISNTIDVLIIIGIYQILNIKSIENIYSTPFKKYYYTKQEGKNNKTFYSYIIQFIIIMIIYGLIKVLLF